jgi:hypothetical protein
MEIKTIKGINEEKWIKLKILAAKNKMTMGKIVETMIDNYEKQNEKFWRDILSGEKIISNKEAEELLSVSKKVRKERGFRDESNI